MTRILVTALLISVLLGMAPPAMSSVERLHVDYTANPSYLPYSITELEVLKTGEHRRRPSGCLQVIRPATHENDTALIVRAINPVTGSTGPASLLWLNATHRLVIDQDPLRATIRGVILYHDNKISGTGAVVGCSRNDSTFAVIAAPSLDEETWIFLATGTDHSGDSVWDAGVSPILVEDYDYDGLDEVFLWVGPARDLRPRLLFCIEPETRRIEWSLPVAGSVDRRYFFSCRDSANPSVIFRTYNYKNGVSDGIFTDHFSSLAKVNNLGEVVYHRLLCEEHGSSGLWRCEADDVFYVFHAFDFIEPSDTLNPPPHVYRLSKIDRGGNVLISTDFPERIRSAWMADFDRNGVDDIYTISQNGCVTIMDTSLAVMARSDPTVLGGYLGTVSIPGQSAPVFLINLDDATAVYSSDFRQLAAFPYRVSDFHPVVYDEHGRVRETYLEIGADDVRVALERQNFWGYIRVMYWEYQEAILALVLTLILVLVLLNAWRQRAVRRQADTERRLQNILDRVQDGVYRTDANGRMVWVSPSAMRIVGYTDIEEVIGRNVLDFYEDPRRRAELLERILAEGSVSDFEVSLRRKDGNIVSISVSAYLLRDANGEVTGVEGIIRDVTDRRKAEEALRKSEEQYRTLVESAREPIFAMDREGVFLFINGEGAGRLGFEPKDIIGKTLHEVFPPAAADHQLGMIQEVFESGRGTIRETPTTIAGQERHYLVSIEPVFEERGTFKSVLCIARDITESKVIRRELAHERDFIHSLLDTAKSLIVCLDSEARITVFNRECEQLTGYSRDEVIGRHFPSLFMLEEDIHSGFDAFEEWVRQNPNDYYEMSIRTKSGEIRTILWSNSAIVPEDGSTITAIGVGQDITDRKKTEQAVVESERRYSTLVESAPDAIIVVDIERKKYVYSNPAAERIFGYTIEELNRMEVGDLAAPAHSREIKKAFQDAAEAGTGAVYEAPMRRKDGRTIYIDITGFRQTYDGREAIIGFLRDVTERKRAVSIQRVLYRIASAVSTTRDLHGLSKFIRNELGTILDTTNFYIALYDAETDMIHHAYVIDEHDDFDAFPAGKTMTAYVIRTGEPLLANARVRKQLLDEGAVETIGKSSKVWLGVPLRVEGKVTGVVVAQSYTSETALDQSDMELLTLVSGQIGVAIERKRVLDSLEETERRFNQALANTQDVLYRLNFSTGTYDYISPSCYDIIGYTSEELIAMGQNGIASIIHEDDLERFLAPGVDASGAQPGEHASFNLVYRMKSKSGKWYWLSDSYTRINDESGEPAFLVGSVRDITELKETEQSLRDSEEKFREIAELAPEAIFEADTTGTITFANRQALEYFGFDDTSSIGQLKTVDMVAPEHRHIAEERFAALISGKRLPPVEYSAQRSDLSTFPARLHTVPILRNETVVGIRGVIVDLSERKAAEEALRQSEERYRLLVENVQASISVVSYDGEYLFVNEALAVARSRTVEEFVGLHQEDLFPPEEADRHVAGIREAIDTGKGMAFEDSITIDGNKRWYSATVQPISELYNGRRAALVISMDVTERREAAEALRLSEERYRLLVENVQAVIAVISYDGKFLFINKLAARDLSMSVEDIVGRSQWDLFPREIADRQMESIRSVIDSGKGMERETEVPVAGKTGWYFTSIQPIDEPYGGRSAALVISADITERREAEAAIRESERKYRELTDLLPLIVYEIGSDGKLLFTNEIGFKTAGITQDDIDRGVSAVDLVAEEDRDRVHKIIKEVLEADGIHQNELNLLDNQGRAFPAIVYGTRIMRHGEAVGLRGVVVDMTEREKSQRQLRDSERRYATLSESAPVGILAADTETREFRYVNSAMCRLTGYSSEELLQMKVGSISPKEDTVNPVRRFESLVAGQGGFTTDLPIQRKDGSIVYTDVTSFVDILDGRESHMGFFVDITSRRKAEEQLRRAARDRYEQVRQIAGGVAHEMHNALFPAMTSLEKLAGRLELSAAADIVRNRRLLDLADQSIDRALSLTNLVTQFSKLDSNRAEDPVDIRAVVEDSLRENSDPIETLGVEVDLDIMPEITLKCFRLHLYSMINNLVLNALDALAESDQRRLSIRAGAKKNGLLIEVEDSGCGIAEADLPRVFNAFFSTKPITGTGLGLAMVSKIADIYGATVEVESRLDYGSKFSIFFMQE